MIEGGCRCGEVRYALDVTDLPASYACHCHQCQRWSGSAFSQQIVVPEERLSISGPVAVFEKTTEDRVSTQRLCATCHTRIYNTNTRRPGFAVVRAGTLDRSEELECRAHIFTEHKQGWVVLPVGAATWRGAPDPTEFLQAMAGV